jgi:acyl carrier protein
MDTSGTSSLTDALKEYLIQNVLDDDVEMDNDTDLGDLGVDSFALVELVLYVEREFGIVLPPSDMTADTMRSIGSLSRCLERHQHIQN